LGQLDSLHPSAVTRCPASLQGPVRCCRHDRESSAWCLAHMRRHEKRPVGRTEPGAPFNQTISFGHWMACANPRRPHTQACFNACTKGLMVDGRVVKRHQRRVGGAHVLMLFLQAAPAGVKDDLHSCPSLADRILGDCNQQSKQRDEHNEREHRSPARPAP